MKKTALIIYLFVIITFLLLIPVQIVNNGLGIAGGVVIGIGLASCVTSLLPFFVSRTLFKTAESNTENRRRYRIAAVIVYIFCFPVKLWAIYMAFYLLYHGEPRWAFG